MWRRLALSRSVLITVSDEKYRWPDMNCGCEIEVTREQRGKGGDQPPQCCCSKEMEQVK
jgi:hypothetical protein